MTGGLIITLFCQFTNCSIRTKFRRNSSSGLEDPHIWARNVKQKYIGRVSRVELLSYIILYFFCFDVFKAVKLIFFGVRNIRQYSRK